MHERRRRAARKEKRRREKERRREESEKRERERKREAEERHQTCVVVTNSRSRVTYNGHRNTVTGSRRWEVSGSFPGAAGWLSHPQEGSQSLRAVRREVPSPAGAVVSRPDAIPGRFCLLLREEPRQGRPPAGSNKWPSRPGLAATRPNSGARSVCFSGALPCL